MDFNLQTMANLETISDMVELDLIMDLLVAFGHSIAEGRSNPEVILRDLKNQGRKKAGFWILISQHSINPNHPARPGFPGKMPKTQVMEASSISDLLKKKLANGRYFSRSRTRNSRAQRSCFPSSEMIQRG